MANQEHVELIQGTQAVPDSKSVAHRMFLEKDGRFLPVKGEFVLREGGEDGKVCARLFTYHLVGPPFTLAKIEPHLADLRTEREPTSYEVKAINAIHARDNAIASTARRPGGYGPDFRIVWSQLEDGCPEFAFGTAFTSALAAYDTMVESSADYADWESGHGQFMSALSTEQRGALSTVYAHANVEMEMRSRAGRSEHWQEIAKPALNAQNAEAEAEDTEASAKAAGLEGVAGKFKALVYGLEGAEVSALGELMGAGGESLTTEGLMECFRMHGEKIMKGVPPVLPWARSAASPPFLGEGLGDWVELHPGSLSPFSPFPGAPSASFAAPVGARPMSGGGHPHGGVPFPGFTAPPGMSPFAPGPNEAFTMGAEEADGRRLEAAVADADALRARIHADANERKRKLGAFKDVVAGGLHWALEKLEGTPPPLPPEPIGPVEQTLGLTGVNGSWSSVIDALQSMSSSSKVGAPGESF